MKPTLSIPIAIILGGAIIAGAVYLSMKAPTAPNGNGNPALVRPVASNDHILGNPTARVLIVEYSDFECSFCKNFHETLNQIIANEGADGDVALVFRHFPLTEIHPNAILNSRAAECAASVGGNDAFWKFIDVLFANQPINPSNYGTYAAEAGISTNDFASCLSETPKEIDDRIKNDRENAIEIGAEGTPYSLILVKGSAGWLTPIVVNGAYSYEALKQLIAQALSNK